MFKKLGTSWNAHTPVYLHPYTKENIIFQLTLTVILVEGIIAYDKWKERRDYPTLHGNTK